MNIRGTLLQQRENPSTTAATEDKSQIITIVTWATLGFLVLSFLARQCIKFAKGKKTGIDDLFILAATVFAIGLSITILILANSGLGVLALLTLRKADIIQKAIYASDYLYVLTLAFAKFSLLSFFHSVHHQRGQRRVVLAIGVFIFAWTLASLAAIAFQCGLPKPWEVLTLHCFNIGVFWITYCIIDMTSDFAIIMLSVNLVAYLKVKLSTKIAVIACFAPRILVIGAALVRLVYLYPISPHNSPAFALWIPIICTQAQSCLTIVTACIPYVRPFFDSAESSIRRLSQARSRRGTNDEESSYGCFSAAYFRGYKRAHDNSAVTTELTYSGLGRTSDVSPRIPSPAPLSPLITPGSTSARSSRSPSERGLRLQIPERTVQSDRAEFASPQTASSIALSPPCFSPHPLLASAARVPMRSSPVTEPEEPRPRPCMAQTNDINASPSQFLPPRRFSLFPPPSKQPSTPALKFPRPPISIPIPITDRSGSSSVTPMNASSTNPTVATRTPSPDAGLHKPVAPYLANPPRPSSSLERIAHDDPLRIVPTAVTTSSAIPAPIPAPLSPIHEPHNSIPSYYIKTPSMTPSSNFSTPQSVPSYYVATPPTSQPATLPPRTPDGAYTVPPAPPVPTSPHRQRNNRILTPQNSSRRDQMSPVSPMTPSTPRAFWRESTETSPRAQRHHGWDDVQGMPRVRDARSSPRVVEQRFA